MCSVTQKEPQKPGSFGEFDPYHGQPFNSKKAVPNSDHAL